ncbi:LuxR family transcriptional regulator [Cellulosimicrobium cellulans]|uniref:LuxR family transcriptional regulator n=1 Tax=Cellulosimicrobium cellulans TaxID=1710 RepID=UPI00130E169C|nr:LuxR family transcriptional regulator [Cellulosimicrobium cellulans]
MPLWNDEARRVLDLVDRGVGVRVTGGPGSGRSALLSRLDDLLRERGRNAFRVLGAAGVPDLEALRLSLPPGLGARLRDPVVVFARLYEVLHEFLADGDHVVLLEDAHLLDPRSRALLGLLRARLGNPVVATVPPGPDAWLARTVQPLAELRLDGLGVDRLHAVLEEHVGCAVSPAVAAQLHAESGGLPVLACALLEAAVADGAVAAADGVVAETGPRRPGADWPWTPHLAGLEQEERDALDVLAVVGGVSTATAEALCGGAVERLEDAGVLRTGRDPGAPERPFPVVQLHPPGLTDRVARAPLTGRRRRVLAEALHRAERTSHADRAAQLLRARLAADGDPPVGVAPPGDLPAHPESPSARDLADAVSAASSARAVAAERHAATRAWRDRGSAEDAVRLVRCLLDSGERATAHEVLDRAERTADPAPFTTVELRYLRARLRLGAGEPCDAVLADLTDLPPCSPAHPALVALSVALQAEFDAVPPDHAAVLAPLTAEPGFGGATARVALAACRLVLGEPRDALGVLAVDRSGWPALLGESADLLTGVAVFGDNRMDDALAHGRAMVRRAADSASPAAVGGRYIAALAMTARLQLADARRELYAVLASGAGARWLVLPPDGAVRVLLATLVLAGWPEPGAEGPLHLARQPTGCGAALPFGDPASATAMDLYAHDDPERAVRVQDEMLERLVERRYGLAADVAQLHRLLLRYDPQRARRTAGGADRLGGPRYAAYLAAARALHDEDPRALMAAGHQLVDLGVRPLAARCFRNAGRLLRLAGDPERAAQADHALRDAEPAAGLASVLTGREREIVGLVALGESNGAIAARLFLSRRTVDAHLRNIRRKTGARDRAEIARLA